MYAQAIQHQYKRREFENCYIIMCQLQNQTHHNWLVAKFKKQDS